MFCSNCGEKIGGAIKYCTHCGHEVNRINNNKDHEKEMGGDKGSEKKREASKQSNPFLWILPLCAFIVTGFVVAGYFLYELKIDKDVSSMIATGESFALEGNLEEAQRLFKRGLTYRPNNKTLLTNLQAIEEGQRFEGLMKEAQDYFNKEEYTSALALLTEVEKQAMSKEGNFYDQFVRRAIFQNANIMLASLDQEQEVVEIPYQLNDVINKLADLEGEETEELHKQILQKVTDIAYNNAQRHLQLNQFTEAVAKIDQGLNYDMENEKLLAFKDTIEQARKSYEEAESIRIERAMQQAAQEDLSNRTESVYLVGWDYDYNYVHNYLSLWGEVQNIGTRPISSVKVYYSVYDIYGEFIGSGEGYIYPNYLMPTANGSFEQGHYVYRQIGNITIDYFTWYVE